MITIVDDIFPLPLPPFRGRAPWRRWHRCSLRPSRRSRPWRSGRPRSLGSSPRCTRRRDGDGMLWSHGWDGDDEPWLVRLLGWGKWQRGWPERCFWRPSSSSLETAATWMALHLWISLQCSKLCRGNPWDSINGWWSSAEIHCQSLPLSRLLEQRLSMKVEFEPFGWSNLHNLPFSSQGYPSLENFPFHPCIRQCVYIYV